MLITGKDKNMMIMIMRQHVTNVHEGIKYDCTSCDYKSGDKCNLNRHIQRKHFVITYTCELCHHV